jgi:hypothetical protein
MVEGVQAITNDLLFMGWFTGANIGLGRLARNDQARMTEQEPARSFI